MRIVHLGVVGTLILPNGRSGKYQKIMPVGSARNAMMVYLDIPIPTCQKKTPAGMAPGRGKNEIIG